MNNKLKGRFGESLATLYLRLKLYKILHRNFTAKTGEIDIVAKKRDTIVFVEVKFRTNKNYGLPREAVTTFKQNQIMRTADSYIMKYNLYDKNIRFDIIEILGIKIVHIKNAFW